MNETSRPATTHASRQPPSPLDPERTRRAWDQVATGYDRYVTPTHLWLAGEALRRLDLAPGARFLDVACGSGALALQAARRGATVTAVDISPVMIERLGARANAAGSAGIDARVMDGHALQLPDAGFDVAASQFGVMLFPDLPRGVAEMVRVIRPGGRVLMNVYGAPDRLEFLSVFLGAMKRVVPAFSPPPMDVPGAPLQVSDPAVLRARLEEAGLRDVEVDTVTETLRFASGEEMWNWITSSNPVTGTLLAGTTEEQRVEVRAALDALVRDRGRNGEPAALTNPVHIAIGTK